MSSDKQKVIYTLLWGNQCISSQNDRQWVITLFGQEVTCHTSTAKTTGSKWWNIPSWEKFHWFVLSLGSMCYCGLNLKSSDSLWQSVSRQHIHHGKESHLSTCGQQSVSHTVYILCSTFVSMFDREWVKLYRNMNSFSQYCMPGRKWVAVFLPQLLTHQWWIGSEWYYIFLCAGLS